MVHRGAADYRELAVHAHRHVKTNKRIMDIEPSRADAQARQLIVKWGGLHAVRSGLGVLATLAFVWALNT